MTREEAINVLRHIAGSYGDVSKYYNAICFAISALSRDRWISVEEPPENGKRYTVCAVEPRFGVKVIDSMRFSEKYGWMYDGKPTDAKVTHYKPLPEPPKEDNNA